MDCIKQSIYQMDQNPTQTAHKPDDEIIQFDSALNKQIDSLQIQNRQQQQNQQPIHNLEQEYAPIEKSIVQQQIPKQNPSRRDIFFSIQPQIPKPLDCLLSQQVPNSFSLLDSQAEDQVTIVSASVNQESGYRKRKRRRRKNREIRPLQIDSKQQSVQQIRQEVPKPCIQLQPPEPEPVTINPIQQQQLLQTLYDDQNFFQNMMRSQNNFTPDQMANFVTRMLVDPNNQMPQVQQSINDNIFQQPPIASFQSLFENPVQKMMRQNPIQALKALALINQTSVKHGQILQIPKVITQIPAIIPLIDRKLPQICQQYVMITSNDLITAEQQKFQVRKLIKSNYKQQISTFILQRLLRVDASNKYNNVNVLKMINSGYVWDNVIPYMAECLYKDSSLVKVRLLPEKSNSDSVSVLKYQAFLIMCQMFFGMLPRQISTFDLPISFGEIMIIGENDSALATENKLQKLKCLLHYFSNILREKEARIKNSVQFIAFQRFRYSLKKEALYPQKQSEKIKYRNLKLTDHLTVSRVKYGNEYKKEIAVYLTHENPCRQAGEQSLQTPFLMQETYRMMYSKPQIFILKALTPKLDLGQAIIVHGLQQCCKCQWQDEQQMVDEMSQELVSRKFLCKGLWNEMPDFDIYGKRKGAVILIMSKLLFNQTFIQNDKEKCHRISENYSFKQLKIQIQALYSAFQGRRNFCSEEERILISERYIKFIENDCRWLYFIVVWIASSIAKVKCVFEFRNSEDENEAVYLMQSLEGWTVERMIEALSCYRQTMIEAYWNWSKYVQKVQQGHPSVHSWNERQSLPFNQMRRVSTMTFIDFLKEIYL